MDSTLTDVLSVREAAERRRSVRAFEPAPIPRDDLEEILEVVRRAPSAFNLQPWRFVVVESAGARERLAAAAYDQRQVRSAPATVVLYTDVADALAHVDEVLHPGMDAARRASGREAILRSFARRSPAEREQWGAEQGNIALGFLLLAAEAYGYQTSTMLGFDPEAVKNLLHLPVHVRIPALVAIGRGAEEGFEHHRHALDRIVGAA
jgi:nitroreductase